MQIAFSSSELRRIADLIDTLDEGKVGSDMYVGPVIITDMADFDPMGVIEYDANGVYGFTQNKEYGREFVTTTEA